MPKKALIFDFDLTLADASQGIYQCMNFALNHFGYPDSDYETIKKTIGYTLPDSFQMLTGNNDSDTAVKFTSLYVSYADKIMNQNTFIYPQVFRLMPEIKKRNLQTAIVSTKYRYRIETILIRDNLDHYFNHIVGGEDVRFHKPHPEGLLLAIEKMKLSKPDVIYVGDSVVDAEAAQNAGIEFCAVLTGTNAAVEFEQKLVSKIIDNLDSLFAVLN